MKRYSLLPALLVLLCALTLSQEARAQGVSGYTSIDYYADSNTIDAYSETDLDYDMMYDYQAYVLLRVTDDYGYLYASLSARDYYDDGFVAVETLFSASPDTNYTARGTHKAYANYYDYDDFYPYRIYYWDSWYFGYYEGYSIYYPWYYYFLSPGYYGYTRRSRYISVGTTYDSDSVSTPAGTPDHMKVVSDTSGQLANCTSTIGRSITFKVVDTNGRNTGSTPMQELFTSLSSNSCRSDGAGPSPDSCYPTDSRGQFTDNITVNCNSVGGSCGYTITDKWQWCPAGQTPTTVGTLTETVHNDAITVNGVTTPSKLKGDIRP